MIYYRIVLIRSVVLATLFLIVRGNISFGQGNRHLDSLISALPSIKDDTLRAGILFELGRDNWFARNFKEARMYLKQSILESERQGYSKNQADAYNLLANVYIKTEGFDSSFYFLKKAIDQKNEKFIPLINETYSKLYYQLGDYNLSLQYALMSAGGYEKSTVPAFSALAVYSYLVIGDIFIKQGQSDRAYVYYKKAFNKSVELHANWSEITSLQKLATYYLSKNMLGKARHLYDTIIVIDRLSANQEPTMFSKEGLGNIAMKEQKYSKAIQFYRQALKYAARKQLSIHQEHFYTRLGSAFLANNQFDSSSWYLNQAIINSQKSKSYSNLSQAYCILSDLQKRQGSFQKALASYELHKSYYDSIVNVEKSRAINNQEVLYQTRLKESEIVRLKETDEINNFAIKKRNMYIILGLLVILALGTILILIRRNYRSKQVLQEERVKQMEQRQQLMSLQSMIKGQEVERTRIAQDLHDGLGGLFSTVKMYFSTLALENEKLKSNEIFIKSYALIDSASTELRRIAHNMMPGTLLKIGLVNAVRDLVNNVNSSKFVTISLEVHGMELRFSANTEIMLYRIIQELISNILNHANASKVIIQFIRDDGRLNVVVEDNGKGFSLKDDDAEMHSGINIIKNRVHYLNGKLTIDSQRDVGTSVMLEFSVAEMP